MLLSKMGLLCTVWFLSEHFMTICCTAAGLEIVNQFCGLHNFLNLTAFDILLHFYLKDQIFWKVSDTITKLKPKFRQIAASIIQ